jgi:hypothetical protein
MTAYPFLRLPMLTLLTGLACLAACGGQPGFPDSGHVSFPAASPVILPDRPAQKAAFSSSAEPALAGSLTSVVLESTAKSEQAGMPVTFGQVFAPGALGAQETLSGKLSDGTDVPLQIDVKAKHPDGSVRHAIISAILGYLAPGQKRTLSLMKAAAAPPTTAGPTPASLLAEGFSASAAVKLGGVDYTASADALLRSGNFRTWIKGPLVGEWLVSAPLRRADGVAHPHLTARFALRWYRAAKRARVDVTIENNWAYEAAPQNFKYDASLSVGGHQVYAKPGLTHYHHSRWRKLFWWGEAPEVHVRHDTSYLIASQAVPNYDQSLVVPETALAALASSWTGPKTEPMGVGLANPYMPSTGGRRDIGLLPGWSVTYLLSMDQRAKDVMLGTADLAGSWSTHYRNKATDRPVSLVDYPYMTILGHEGDTYNRSIKRSEWFPACGVVNGCKNVNTHDSSHQPNFAYLPYLVTGDYFYLEELQFWGMWNSFMSNPAYREYGKALLKSDQVRGQAWALRSLAEAAYITPDADLLKSHFTSFTNSNLDWYNAEYANNPSANALGVLINGYAIVYDGGTGVAPWQDDFFTSAVGHASELGFDKAKKLLAYKTKFPIARMTAPGSCWIDGALFNLKVRSQATSPLFTSMAQAYAASHTPAFNQLPCAGPAMAASLKLKVGEMTGYSSEGTGYPSNMQPALAYAADVNGVAGQTAWKVFMNRSVKPNYALNPQFAIIPRPR